MTILALWQPPHEAIGPPLASLPSQARDDAQRAERAGDLQWRDTMDAAVVQALAARCQVEGW